MIRPARSVITTSQCHCDTRRNNCHHSRLPDLRSGATLTISATRTCGHSRHWRVSVTLSSRRRKRCSRSVINRPALTKDGRPHSNSTVLPGRIPFSRSLCKSGYRAEPACLSNTTNPASKMAMMIIPATIHISSLNQSPPSVFSSSMSFSGTFTPHSRSVRSICSCTCWRIPRPSATAS
ncbi:Uncharacterised protein [Salmonella enterica subsp. arizonae]|uniref:Uncharacterized protein n=1 Tax=Salmonella enterica subsp. arizonae TaxID=59203 RepID=A0A379T5L7_SALER|nr:Uncharacterised protein [Salmonella enterica subsp. arizonae]